MSNLKIGNECEKKIIELLRQQHYFVYRCPVKANGQPVDIICARGKDGVTTVFLIDAKHLREDDVSFTLDRIEPNQWSSLQYASEFAGINNSGFAIYSERTQTVYWLPFSVALDFKKNKVKSINCRLLRVFEEVIK